MGGEEETVQEAVTETEASGINGQVFEELRLGPEHIDSVKVAWDAYIEVAGSRDAAGEALYNAIFEGTPQAATAQAFFQTPRAVQAARFMRRISDSILALTEPKRLKMLTDVLACEWGLVLFNNNITVNAFVDFRDAILDLLAVELGANFARPAKDGLKSLLNYIGGAIMFVKDNYPPRLKMLSDSWAIVNKKSEAKEEVVTDFSEIDSTGTPVSKDTKDTDAKGVEQQERRTGGLSRLFSRKGKSRNAESTNGEQKLSTTESKTYNHSQQKGQFVMNFTEMFHFNAGVMGYQGNTWMDEVLSVFDELILSVSNSSRLSDECNVLALRITKYTENSTQKVNLSEYKQCMLASLRSLLPKVWDSAHEVAWNWLWDTVETLLNRTMGKPLLWESRLKKVLDSWEESERYKLRAEVYVRFFAAAPAGQDMFKQSNTYLHVIADRILGMSVTFFENPTRTVDTISALGLRHVGYGIAVDLFPPFVTTYVEVVSEFTTDQVAFEAFRYSLGLISSMLVRTIDEGSTIVMKAIHANSAHLIKEAVQTAPRGERAEWVLVVQVGNQSISPLLWSVTCGCLEAASAIIEDLLTIRADRERYYYGVDDLWNQHPDIIKQLIDNAPGVLPTLWKHLVWRCSSTQDRMRRVNYYIKHLIVDNHGDPDPALQWICDYRDPQTMQNPLLIVTNDILWQRLVVTKFVFRKAWFVLSLAVFMLIQVILPKLPSFEEPNVRMAILIGRCVNYGCILSRLLVGHIILWTKAYCNKETMKVFRCIPIPGYLKDTYEKASLLLTLLLSAMLATEPMFWCYLFQDPSDPALPSEHCAEADKVMLMYSLFCMAAMAVQWLLIVDMAIFSTQLSAFVLVIRYVMNELSMFMIALGFLLLTFGSAISVLDHDQEGMQTIMESAVALFAITVKLYQDDYRSVEEPALVLAVFFYQTAVSILLLNLLIAQLQCSYEYVHQDAIGFARLNRCKVIAEVIAKTRKDQWQKFVLGLDLDKNLEFNEGDVGVSGGVQILEPARNHPIVEDTILRFGGSCAPEMPWPKEDNDAHEAEDKFDRIEKVLQKTLKRMAILDPAGSPDKMGRQASGQSGTGSNATGDHGERPRLSSDESLTI